MRTNSIIGDKIYSVHDSFSYADTQNIYMYTINVYKTSQMGKKTTNAKKKFWTFTLATIKQSLNFLKHVAVLL